MKIQIEDGLPIVSISLGYKGKILILDNVLLDSFQIQLGITKETYGFNGILGVDFMIKSGLVIDFKEKAAFRK